MSLEILPPPSRKDQGNEARKNLGEFTAAIIRYEKYHLSKLRGIYGLISFLNGDQARLLLLKENTISRLTLVSNTIGTLSESSQQELIKPVNDFIQEPTIDMLYQTAKTFDQRQP